MSENRWLRFAEHGVCEYCGVAALVQPEPFGNKPACQPCWEQICYGTGEE